MMRRSSKLRSPHQLPIVQPSLRKHCFFGIETDHEPSEDEDVIYMVITEYRERSFPDKTRVITQRPDLEEANQKARRYLDEEYGPGLGPED